MIYGIGTDIVVVARMTALFSRHGERALARLLAPAEISRCMANAAPARYLAKRFAAKEALAKALGTGLRVPVTLNSMAVLNDAMGKPCFQFYGALAEYMTARGLTVHLSISDEQDSAIAFVVIEHFPELKQ